MKIYSLITLLTCSILSITTHANTLIITRGPVCIAMGTYLCNAVKSVDDTYDILCQKDIYNMTYYNVFNDLFPQQMSIISKAIERENISYAITNYHVYFKETAYAQQKQQALDAIAFIQQELNKPENEHIYTDLIRIGNHLVMADLAYHSACKYNVVWQGGTVINFDNDAILLKDGFDTVIETITYCPPITMIEQWQQKEAQAINEKKASKRSLLKQVLKTFFNNFIPTDNEQDAVIILTRSEFDAIIQQTADYIQTVPQGEIGVNGTFTRTEFTLEELAEFKEKIYAQFNFDAVDHVALVPSLTYDVLLSSKEECLNFAHNITTN